MCYAQGAEKVLGREEKFSVPLKAEYVIIFLGLVNTININQKILDLKVTKHFIFRELMITMTLPSKISLYPTTQW